MDPQTLFFWIFASITVLAAFMVITSRNPVHSALYLVLTFFSCAGIWLLLKAEFLAITLVLVYVGAVMVLFLFVVMMLDVNIDKLREGFWKNFAVAGVVGMLILIELSLVLFHSFKGVRSGDVPALPANYSNTKALGALIYTEYVLAFEVAAVILLVGMVAAIALTLRRRKDSKFFNPTDAIRTKAKDRLRIVKMPATSARALAAQGGATEATAPALTPEVASAASVGSISPSSTPSNSTATATSAPKAGGAA
jgi:NADH-quinone oxidoreductase subunit J